MSDFKEILELMDRDIDSYNYHVEEIEKEIQKNKEVLRIITLIDSNSKKFLSQVKNIINYYPELNNYIMLLNEIESIYESIRKGHYEEVLPDRIRVCLTASDVASEEVIKVLDDFTLCDKLKNYVEMDNADTYTVEIVKNAYFNILDYLSKAFDDVFNKLSSEIRARYNLLGNIEILQKRRDDMDKKISNVKKIKSFFNENGLINTINNNDLKLFYKWLENTKFTKKIDLIKSIILEQIKGKDKTKEEIVMENREEVIERVKGVLSSKSIFDAINLLSFTEEEKNIILQVKKVYINKSSQCSERVYFSNKELGDRKDSYFHNNKVEWEIILADIEDNLIPNIGTSHHDIMERLKYIIEVYNGELQFQKYVIELNEKEKILKSYIDNLSKLFNIDNLHDTTYDYLFRDNIDSSDSRYDGKYDYYSIRYFIRNNIQAFVTNLEREINIIEKIIDGHSNYQETLSKDEFKSQYENLMQEYHLKWRAYSEYEKRKYIDEVEESLNNPIKANLVICFDDVSFDNRHGNYDEGKKKEYDSTVKSLESMNFDILSHPFGRKEISEILYHPATKNKMRKKKVKKAFSSFDNEYFTPFRYSGTGYYRTGVIMFPLCKENKDKLKEKYNLGDSFAVFAIFKIIKAEKDNHKDYSEFVGYIRKNEEWLEDIGDMFLDPDVDFKELCNVIDNGLQCKERFNNYGETK